MLEKDPDQNIPEEIKNEDLEAGNEMNDIIDHMNHLMAEEMAEFSIEDILHSDDDENSVLDEFEGFVSDDGEASIDLEQEEEGEIVHDIEEDNHDGCLFDPPLYLMRYRYVMDILEQEQSCHNNIKTIADLGCNECKFMKYFRNGDLEVDALIGVDVDEAVLTNVAMQLKPLPSHYLNPKSHPFEIELFAGSITDKDQRLYKVDAVCAIELIEHLHPDELLAFPKTVFGFMQPRVAIITTPNKEYNVIFKDFDDDTFRHPDHKFEWTREEFKRWANGVISEYPEYEVEFDGVGYPDLRPNPEGPCSQIAVFRRKSDATYRALCDPDFQPYKRIVKHVYPVDQDERSLEQKIADEVIYVSRIAALEKRNESDEEKYSFAISVEDILQFHTVSKLCVDVEKLVEACQSNGVIIKDNMVIVDLEDPLSDHCPIFGSHQYDLECGAVYDCACFDDDSHEDDPPYVYHCDADADEDWDL